MPMGDTAEQAALLAAYFGADDTGVPTSFAAALFTGSPYDAGVELDYPGYSRVTVTNDTTHFVNGGDGTITATVNFPDATDAAGTGSSVVTDDGTVWVLFHGSAVVAWDFLESPLSVDGAGSVTPLEITPYIASDGTVGS